VVVVAFRDHHQLVPAGRAELTFESAQVRPAPVEVVQQTQYVEMRAELIPQRHKGFLQRLHGQAGPVEFVVNRHRSSLGRTLDNHHGVR
jgi:hypothetical protein